MKHIFDHDSLDTHELGRKKTNARKLQVNDSLEKMGGSYENRLGLCVYGVILCLCTLSTDAASQLDVLGHDGDTLGVDGAQVSVFKQTNQVGFAGFLQSHDG